MAPLPPLRNLRKTTVLVIVVFFSFLINRCVYIFKDDAYLEREQIATTALAKNFVCQNIVRGALFGVDSLFEENTRLYVQSVIANNLENSKDTLKHIWFLGLDTIQILPCIEQKYEHEGDGEANKDFICHTEISPKKLIPGEWSVDLVLGRKLLTSEQFRVEPHRR